MVTGSNHSGAEEFVSDHRSFRPPVPRRRMSPTNNSDFFLALDSAARSAVLEEPLREVVMLLEQNVLAEFKQHLTLVMQVRALEAEKVRPRLRTVGRLRLGSLLKVAVNVLFPCESLNVLCLSVFSAIDTAI